MTSNPDLAEGRVPTFEELARRPDDRLDLALGAALVAKDADPRVDVRAVLAKIDALGAPLADAGLGDEDARAQAEAVSARFRELGFRGNVEDYYDPRNSLLHAVLERRLGIPITLAIVWCEIARRARVRARGVGFPGHVLVRVDAPGSDAPIIVDAFEGGRIVDDAIATSLLRRALGDGAELHPSLFEPATARAMLVRLLTNLKSIWATRGDHARAFVAIDRILTLTPDAPRVLRERAAAALRLGAGELARSDLARVVELEPQAPDVPQIAARIAQLGGAARRPLN
jgi:regulator of sirC expression with transglutaminase-like and TPR domain